MCFDVSKVSMILTAENEHSLTGADTVIFYDSDFNPQMDKQCEDRLGFPVVKRLILGWPR